MPLCMFRNLKKGLGERERELAQTRDQKWLNVTIYLFSHIWDNEFLMSSKYQARFQVQLIVGSSEKKRNK